MNCRSGKPFVLPLLLAIIVMILVAGVAGAGSGSDIETEIRRVTPEETKEEPEMKRRTLPIKIPGEDDYPEVEPPEPSTPDTSEKSESMLEWIISVFKGESGPSGDPSPELPDPPDLSSRMEAYYHYYIQNYPGEIDTETLENLQNYFKFLDSSFNCYLTQRHTLPYVTESDTLLPGAWQYLPYQADSEAYYPYPWAGGINPGDQETQILPYGLLHQGRYPGAASQPLHNRT